MKRLLPVWAALLIAAAPVAALWAPGTAVAAGAGVTFQETPSLAGRVAEGKLPPVEDRVPKVPSVVFMNAKDKTPGRHGGDMRLIMGKGRDVRLMTIYGYARLVAYTTDLKLVADILERFEVKDGREFTLTLRPGHKWSDGHPFTAEDFRYYWQDMATNKKLSPLGPRKKLLVGEELPEFKVIDKRTVRYTWSRPNSFFLAGMAGAAPFFIYRPAHYMKRFHARYSDTAELKKMAEKERLMDWSVLHQSKDRMYTLDNPEMPTLQPWMNTTKPPSQRFVFVRNPFFHRVDAAGRQLGAAEQLSGLGAVDAAVKCLLIEQALDEVQLFSEWRQRLKDLPQLHLRSLTLGPPLLRMEAVPGKQAREAYGRLICAVCGFLSSPDR